MRESIHTDYDGKPLNPAAFDEDDCMLDNLNAPVIRSGNEPFKSYYAVEWAYNCFSAIDPSRSFVETLVKAMDERCSAENNWPTSDAIHVLLRDLGILSQKLTRADVVAFWTMFPKGLSAFLSLPYMKLTCFNNPHGDVVRVLNNPFSYRDANAPYGRLVEIAEVNGFRFALDRSKFLPEPDVVAKEIALLNHGVRNPERVDEVTISLTSSIAAILEDWGLVPQVKHVAE